LKCGGLGRIFGRMDFVMGRPTSAVSMVFAACARPSGVAEGSACAFALQMMMATAAPVRSGNVMRPPDISCRGEKISCPWLFIRKSRL
jgi:hypothetical protein